MALTILWAIALVSALTMLIKQIRKSDDKGSIATTTLASGQLVFDVSESGRYTVWTKRIAKYSSSQRNVHNYSYRMKDNTSGHEIALIKEKDNTGASNYSHSGRHRIETRWKTHYTFEADPGEYTLTFEKTNLPVGGIFNLFKEIDPEKFNIEITPYSSKGNDIKKGLFVALFFVLTLVSFILFLNTFSE